MRVEIYSDVVCPWCYIGERRFERALAAFPRGEEVEVVYRPYQLDPGAPAAPVPLKQYLERRFGGPAEAKMRPVDDAAKGEGLTFDWDRAIAVSTLNAHRLLELALRERGHAVQRVLVERLFAAHFAQGADVSDPELLAELAAAEGLDRATALAYLRSDEGVKELREELDEARTLGIRAVPTFLFEGQYVVEGAQSASAFLQVLEEVERRSAAAVGAGEDAACVDGSCAV